MGTVAATAVQQVETALPLGDSSAYQPTLDDKPQLGSVSTSCNPGRTCGSPFLVALSRTSTISAMRRSAVRSRTITLLEATGLVSNYRTFVPVFESAGFEVTLLEWCDEHGSFHQADWSVFEDGPTGRATELDGRNERWHAGTARFHESALGCRASSARRVARQTSASSSDHCTVRAV